MSSRKSQQISARRALDFEEQELGVYKASIHPGVCFGVGKSRNIPFKTSYRNTAASHSKIKHKLRVTSTSGIRRHRDRSGSEMRQALLPEVI